MSLVKETLKEQNALIDCRNLYYTALCFRVENFIHLGIKPLGYLGVNGRIILKLILWERVLVNMVIDLCVVKKVRNFSERQSLSQEGLCSKELVIVFRAASFTVPHTANNTTTHCVQHPVVAPLTMTNDWLRLYE
jgi:hypothetical protein